MQQADLLAERIQSSYPFHPDLLDLMYHRWGSLLSTHPWSLTVSGVQFMLCAAGDTSLLIGPVIFPEDEGVRGAFFSQVGERALQSVIEADLIGRAKVKAVDNRIAQDALSFKTGNATGCRDLCCFKPAAGRSGRCGTNHRCLPRPD